MGRTFSGGCPCGAVRFRTRGEPRDWIRCDCAPCRSSLSRARGRGDPVWPNAGVEFAGGRIASAEHLCAEVSRPMTVHSCAACGTPVSMSIDGSPSTRCVFGVNFDEPSQLHGAVPVRSTGEGPSAAR